MAKRINENPVETEEDALIDDETGELNETVTPLDMADPKAKALVDAAFRANKKDFVPVFNDFWNPALNPKEDKTLQGLYVGAQKRGAKLLQHLVMQPHPKHKGAYVTRKVNGTRVLTDKLKAAIPLDEHGHVIPTQVIIEYTGVSQTQSGNKLQLWEVSIPQQDTEEAAYTG